MQTAKVSSSAALAKLHRSPILQPQAVAALPRSPLFTTTTTNTTQANTLTPLAPPVSSQGALDFTALGIVPKRQCWVLHVDGLVLNDDGGILDALSMGMRVRQLSCSCSCSRHQTPDRQRDANKPNKQPFLDGGAQGCLLLSPQAALADAKIPSVKVLQATPVRICLGFS